MMLLRLLAATLLAVLSAHSVAQDGVDASGPREAGSPLSGEEQDLARAVTRFAVPLELGSGDPTDLEGVYPVAVEDAETEEGPSSSGNCAGGVSVDHAPSGVCTRARIGTALARGRDTSCLDMPRGPPSAR